MRSIDSKETQLRDDELITLTLRRGELKEMGESAWHDSATRTGERLLALAEEHERRLAVEIGRERAESFIVGPWTHIFMEGGRQVERPCRFVFDCDRNEVTHLQIRRDSAWRSGSNVEMVDLTDSLVNANEEAISDPTAWDLIKIDHIPEWALLEGN